MGLKCGGAGSGGGGGKRWWQVENSDGGWVGVGLKYVGDGGLRCVNLWEM